MTISATVHAQKTEKNTFEDALQKSGLLPVNCIFIDNTARNLEVPKRWASKLYCLMMQNVI